MTNPLYLLSDAAIDIRLDANLRLQLECTDDTRTEMERERQGLLALRLERDMETWLAKLPPERAEVLRPMWIKGRSNPQHRRLIDGEPSKPSRDMTWSLKSKYGQCTASVKTDEGEFRCRGRAMNAGGLCSPHQRKLAANTVGQGTQEPK